jgi:hypothetical protein
MAEQVFSYDDEGDYIPALSAIQHHPMPDCQLAMTSVTPVSMPL